MKKVSYFAILVFFVECISLAQGKSKPKKRMGDPSPCSKGLYAGVSLGSSWSDSKQNATSNGTVFQNSDVNFGGKSQVTQAQLSLLLGYEMNVGSFWFSVEPFVSVGLGSTPQKTTSKTITPAGGLQTTNTAQAVSSPYQVDVNGNVVNYHDVQNSTYTTTPIDPVSVTNGNTTTTVSTGSGEIAATSSGPQQLTLAIPNTTTIQTTTTQNLVGSTRVQPKNQAGLVVRGEYLLFPTFGISLLAGIALKQVKSSSAITDSDTGAPYPESATEKNHNLLGVKGGFGFSFSLKSIPDTKFHLEVTHTRFIDPSSKTVGSGQTLYKYKLSGLTERGVMFSVKRYCCREKEKSS